MNILKKISIRTQLFTIAVFIIVVILLIFLITYLQITKNISNINDENTNDMFAQIRQTISSNCDLTNRILSNIAYNSVIQDYMLEQDPIKKYDAYKKVTSFLTNMQDISEGILNIIIISDNGNTYYQKGKSATITKILNNLPDKIINFYTKSELIETYSQEINCFIVASEIYSIDQNSLIGNRIGIAAIVLNTDFLSFDIDKIFKGSPTKYFLLDRSGYVYSSNDLDMKSKKLASIGNKEITTSDNIIKFDKNNFIVKQEDIPEIGGKIISIVPKKDLYAGLAHTRTFVIKLFIAALVILFIPCTFLINNILQPLRKFMDFINLIKLGNLKNLKKRIQLGGYSEISIMADEFNGMLDEIDNLTHRLLESNSRLYEAELEKKQSELAFLQSQINPHFLYNTLESIIGIATVARNNKIVEIAESLGKIFRYNVKGEEMVSIREELNIVDSYIRVQKIRFEGRFEVTSNFYDEVLECKVPKMILQPIIENSLYHGLEPKRGKGHLTITGTIEEDGCISIKITDDGIGIDSDVVCNITNALNNCTRYKGSYKTGLGIINVNNRIKLTYGNQYGIILHSESEIGTEVLLKIPVRR